MQDNSIYIFKISKHERIILLRDSYVDSKTIEKIKILSQKYSHYFWEREELVIREKHTRASGVLATFISWLGW